MRCRDTEPVFRECTLNDAYCSDVVPALELIGKQDLIAAFGVRERLADRAPQFGGNRRSAELIVDRMKGVELGLFHVRLRRRGFEVVGREECAQVIDYGALVGRMFRRVGHSQAAFDLYRATRRSACAL